MRRARKAARAPATWPPAAAVLAVLTLAAGAGTAATPAPPEPDTLAALGGILPPIVVDNFDELVKAASATCEALPRQLLFARTTAPELPLTEVVQYTRRARRSHRVLSAHRTLRAPPGERVVLYVPGWWNTPADASSQAIVRALMTRHRSVLLLDTRLSFCRGYISAVSSINPLSHLLFSFVKNLHKKGHSMSSIHLIGFSLGAHVAGMTGKLVKMKLNATIGQITALDPARPCFARADQRLERGDAEFVQVIHSSAGVLGIEEPLGHADVYVNGVPGKHPECEHKAISLECDHAQAWKLFAASAVNEKVLMGRQCANWGELLQNMCSGNETQLGYACRPDAHGMFLYKSRSKSKPPPAPRKPSRALRWPLAW
ncbi:phospholipase A1 member A-like [Trichoplusia ni]|uniref:Phospholipase A1 member A-like n=1 Tax=Trichoplusia ni TaxID=7111 RepID=A0A7E5VBN1_TRINI|nr:phospholipase A1 member A-like [Trichoplusia ni]